MNRPIRAVVFDLDGTLVDSMPLVLRAYAHAVLPYLPSISDDELRRAMGGPPERILEQLLRENTAVAAALERLNQFGTANWGLIAPFPGAAELLEELSRAGVKIAVWTGRERHSTELILSKNRIGAIDACICGDDLSSHKPDPAGLTEVLRRLGFANDEVLFVGDAEVDLVAGVAVEVPTLLISHGQPVGRVLAARAWRVVKTPAEAYALVRDTVNRV